MGAWVPGCRSLYVKARLSPASREATAVGLLAASLRVICETSKQGPCREGGEVPGSLVMPGKGVAPTPVRLGGPAVPGSVAGRKARVGKRAGLDRQIGGGGGRKVGWLARNLPRAEHRGEASRGATRGLPCCPRRTGGVQIEAGRHRTSRHRDRLAGGAPQLGTAPALVWTGDGTPSQEYPEMSLFTLIRLTRTRHLLGKKQVPPGTPGAVKVTKESSH
jgi:hypothetical protein